MRGLEDIVEEEPDSGYPPVAVFPGKELERIGTATQMMGNG